MNDDAAAIRKCLDGEYDVFGHLVERYQMAGRACVRQLKLSLVNLFDVSPLLDSSELVFTIKLDQYSDILAAF
ncbi:MAG: hypothetical protein ACRD6X_13560 [Pyrinomonadaceae bacterium]